MSVEIENKDAESPWGKVLNETLEKLGRDERFIQIYAEDKVIAEGIWTPEEVKEISGRVAFDPNAEKHFVPDNNDYCEIAESSVSCEVFRTNSEAIDALLASGIFRKKAGSGEYMLLGMIGDEFHHHVDLFATPSFNVFGKDVVSLSIY